jgi:phage shock protein C
MTSDKQLRRNSENGKIAGVCAGIADYFGIETWLVRIATVAATLLSGGPLIPVFYIAAWFILDKEETSKGFAPAKHVKHKPFHGSGKGWRNEAPDEEKKVEVKSKVWQSGEPPRQAFYDIKERFSRIETRLRKIETYVTSSEYQLNREINKL